MVWRRELLCRSALAMVSVALIVFTGCAKRSVKDILPPVDAVPVWFRIDDRFSDVGKDEKTFAHPFFDLAHFASPQDHSINFFPINTVASPFLYGLDLVSGRRYRKGEVCEQRDVWEKYPRVIKGALYTEGIVPRL